MKAKLLIIILFCNYFTTVFSFNKCEKDTNFVQITVKEYVSDTMIFEIENISADTLFISIYRQAMSKDSVVITDNNNIYGGLMTTVVIKILPNSKIELKERIYEFISTDNIIIEDIDAETIIVEKYRLLVKVRKRLNEKTTNNVYSNWIYRR